MEKFRSYENVKFVHFKRVTASIPSVCTLKVSCFQHCKLHFVVEMSFLASAGESQAVSLNTHINQLNICSVGQSHF